MTISNNFLVANLLENELILVIWGQFYIQFWDHPPGIYLLKVNSGNTRKMCEISSKLTIKIPEQILWCGVFIVDFEQVNVGLVMSLILTFNNIIFTFFWCRYC